jgi:hypothetical protein
MRRLRLLFSVSPCAALYAYLPQLVAAKGKIEAAPALGDPAFPFEV